MRLLLDKCSGNEVLLSVADETLLQANEQVKITEGQMAGMSGKVKWSHQQRVCVILSFFGRQTPVEFPRGHVERAITDV